MLFGTPFGFCFFSTLHGNSSIKPHSGPMNLRLRMHLPLVVPSTSDSKDDTSSTPSPHGNNNNHTTQQQNSTSSAARPTTGIRVADQTREWHEGSAIILDDSYVHEVWNDSDTNDSLRVLFLLDLWHPDVRMEEREKITNMFDYARGKGWIGATSSK